MTQCRSLGEVRDQIDLIDARIAPLLAERTALVEQAVRFKPTKHDVLAADRTEEIILKVRHAATEHGADSDLIEKIYRAMIDAFVLHEARLWREQHSQG